MKTTYPPLTKKSHIIVLITALSLIIIVSGYLFYKHQESSIQQQKYNELKAITDLKVKQIESWIQESRADANVITQSPFFVQGINNWLKTGNTILKQDIIERLQPVQKDFGYENIFLTKPNGQLLLSVKDELQEFEPFVKQKIVEASQKHEILFTDLYRCQTDNKIHYDVISPIIDDNKNTIAILVFRRDPHLFLYPLIQSWPTPSPSSETAILRVENDSVVFLNELRHDNNTALNLKIPLTRKEIPAVQAALGRTGLFEGIDYRGAEVLSDIRIITVTNWIMLSKVDKSEIYSGIYLLAVIISCFSIFLIIIVGVSLAFIYKSRQQNIFVELYNKEKELWQHQERFKVTMESLGEGIITTDLNGKVQYLNSRAEELTGWKLREAKGRELSEIYYVKNEETGQIENNILEKVFKHGIVKELANHTILITKSGKEIPVMDTGAPIYDADGSIIGIVIAFQDETEKRTQQKLIRESEFRFHSTLDNMMESCQIIGYDWKYIYLNKEAEKQNRRPNVELLGNKVMDMWPGIESTKVFQMMRQCMEERLLQQKEIEFTFSDQHKEWFNVRIEPSLEGIFIRSSCITDRKLAEEKLSKSEEQFRLITENVADMIAVLDLDGKRLYNNPAYEPILGDPKLSQGTDSFQEIHPDDRDKIKRIFKETVQTGIGQRAEYRFIAKDGSIHYIESQGSVIRDENGKVSKVVVISRNITEKKLMEQQLLRSQRMESIGTLAGGIAHDLNNVLAPIMLAIEILRKKYPDADGQRMLEMMGTSAKRGSDIVKQVLAFGRGVEGEKVLLQPKHVVDEIVKIARETFSKDIQIRTDVPKNLWVISADPTQMHQVLLNAFVNARDAMPSGGTISISAENIRIDEHYARMHIEGKAGNYVLISVADTGAGIPPEILDRIFEPFFTTKEIGKGTGLGLSTVRSIVKSHGGFINVYSEEHKGTTFNFYLPAKTKDQAIEKDEKKPELPFGNGELILVVDDEASIREITKETLEASGYRVLAAGDGTEAIAIYADKGSKIAVVITDMMMPIMDGARTIRALRNMNPTIKIIASSGLNAHRQTIQDDKYSADVFITKPYTAEKLLETVHSVLHK